MNMVCGYPLSHTQSPLLHNIVYRALNINYDFVAVESNDLEQIITIIKNRPIELTAITMPFKQDILRYLDSCSPEVNQLKAANTIIYRNGKLHGYNTDVDGIAYALQNISIFEKNILIIGAGGAARAFGFYAYEKNANLLWLNRSYKNALLLAHTFGGEVVNLADINNIPLDIIINTTPIGMYPNVDVTPLPGYSFKQGQIVFDMVYNPMKTKLLKDVQNGNARALSGFEMFIGQAMRQIELWTHKEINRINLIDKIRSACQEENEA